MDTERWRVNAETAAIRGRTLVRSVVQVAGVVAVLLGAYNLLLYPSVGETLWVGYRSVLPMVTAAGSSDGGGIIAVSDVILMAVGAVLAWFV